MLSGRAFRAQLVMQGQRELFDYWLRSAGGRRMPARSDLDPLKVPRLLPHIGLIDLKQGIDQTPRSGWPERGCTRSTGRRSPASVPARCFPANRRTIGTAFTCGLVAKGCPRSGVVRGPAKGRDHIVLFWLRLPLSEDGGRVDRILCYDVAVPGGRAGRAGPHAVLLFPHSAETVGASGAIRLSLEPAQRREFSFIGTDQAEMPIEVIAPMT